MNFTEENKDMMASIAAKHSTNIQAAIAAAFEEGILEGAMRTARNLALQGLSQAPAATTPTGSNGNGDDDDDETGVVTTADAAWLRAQGIDPTKKFRIKNSVFTITGVKRSRWKFPISGTNQNGTRYKFPISSVKAAQLR